MNCGEWVSSSSITFLTFIIIKCNRLAIVHPVRCSQNPTTADEMMYSTLNSMCSDKFQTKNNARQWLSNKCQKCDTFYELHVHALYRSVYGRMPV